MSTGSNHRPKPVVLAILDGWGHRDDPGNNAIAAANTPNWDRLTRDFPSGLINASELHVGLPSGQMGNSEVGHMNIGSGRVLMQDLPKIDAAIQDGSLAENPVLREFIGKLTNKRCHLLGLLSPGGVHSHQSHMAALANILTSAGIEVKVHAFFDGRDTPPQSALKYVREFESAIEVTGDRLQVTDNNSKISSVTRAPLPVPPPVIATVSGRYYVMDRDKRWERVQKAYDTLVDAKGARFANAAQAIEASYAAGVSDEFVLPAALGDYRGMQDGDGLLMANFRADRVREILTALVDPAFNGFARARRVAFCAALGMNEYSAQLAPLMPALFPPQQLRHILGEVVAEAGLKQLRIAETEKYAHVTFFFNGGREQEFPGEERILVPSPKVATYDLKPEMSAFEVTDKLLAAIAENRFDLIVVNYANTDMVGHTGNLEAAKKAVEAVDACLGRLAHATLAAGGALLITADHGNAEMMFDPASDQAHTAHTLNLVPFVAVWERLRGKKIAIGQGKLGDVAPTILAIMQLPQPAEMSGKSLLAGYV
jgi:2,3-bisphosphoglycerate-independent phosphoglycerate mutase